VQWSPGGYKGEVLPYFIQDWENAPERWLLLVEGEKVCAALAEFFKIDVSFNFHDAC